MKNNFVLTILFLTLSILLVGTSLNSIYAQENMTDVEEPKFFAIQHAQSGSISEINETAYSLQLNDVSDKTILFSDRPDRIVTSVSTSDFIGNWATGEDSYSTDAPNAALIIDELERQDIAILELFNPVYDSEKKSLTYEVTPVNTISMKLTGEFEHTTLVIDPQSDGDASG
ncbi:MAG: hypothetical protein ACPKPY_05225 [Nitrososphaeraceae archaeon]